MNLEKDDSMALENLIDRYNLHSVISELAVIAHEKSDHVLSTWQDKNLASLWTAAGNYLEKAAETRSIIHL